LQNASSSFGITDTREPEDYGNELKEKDEELAEMRKKIVKYEEENNTLRISASKSEGTLLKELAMETLLKLTLSSDIEKLITRKD
jgi:predicted transcriptional regulator